LHYPKLDMPEGMLKAYLAPPASPADCIFARTTRTISADFKTKVEPCQFGGDPDCSRCGCIASMALSAIGNHKLVGGLTAGHIFMASAAVGEKLQRILPAKSTRGEEPRPSELTTIQPASDMRKSA
jgi:hypothetical protein